MVSRLFSEILITNLTTFKKRNKPIWCGLNYSYFRRNSLYSKLELSCFRSISELCRVPILNTLCFCSSKTGLIQIVLIIFFSLSSAYFLNLGIQSALRFYLMNTLCQNMIEYGNANVLFSAWFKCRSYVS